MINTNYPISILPAFSISSQIEFLRRRLDSLIYDQDQYHLTFFTSVLSKFENQEYEQFFPGPGEIITDNTLLWAFSNIGICVTELDTKNIFFLVSTEILSYIRKSLREAFDWVILITKTDIILFSLYEQHYLCWSFLLQKYNKIILSLILANPSEMDIYNNSYPLREYSLSLKCLKSINKQITSLNNIKNTSYSKIQKEFSILSTFSGILEVQNSFLRQIEGLCFEKWDESTKIMLKTILDGLESWIEQNEWKEIELLDFLSISLISLIEIPPYEISVKESRGQFNTPLNLTFSLIKYSLDATLKMKEVDTLNLFKKKILDPAMGTGMILLVALEWLTNFRLEFPLEQNNPSFMQLRLQVFSQNLTGFDIDRKMVDYSTKIFQIYLNTSIESIKSIKSLIQVDFLSEYIRKTKKTERIQFFDIVLSNPPYLALHSRFIKIPEKEDQLSNLKAIIPEFLGLRDNLYVAFLGLALMHVTPPKDAIVGFVLDRSFLDLPSYKSLRKALVENFNIQYLLENFKYDHAVVDLAVIVFKKSKTRIEDFYHQSNIGESPTIKQSSEFRTNINYSYRISALRSSRQLISQIKASSISLEKICKISCGLEYGSLLKTHFLSSEEKKDFFPVLDGANALPYSYILFWVPDQSNSYVRFSKEYESDLIAKKKNISATNSKHVYLISGEKNRFINPKLVLRQTSSKFIGSYDEEGYFALRNLHLLYDTHEPYSLKLILGILTSEFGNWIGRELNIIRVGSKKSHRYPQIRIGDLKQFPVPIINKGDNKCRIKVKNIETIVNSNLQIGKFLSKAYTEIWNLIKLNAGNIKLSSQKRLFQLPKKVNKLEIVDKIVKDELLTKIQYIKSQEDELSRNCKELNKNVLEIYNFSETDWIEGMKSK